MLFRSLLMQMKLLLIKLLSFHYLLKNMLGQLYGNFTNPDPSVVNSDFLTTFSQDPFKGSVLGSHNSSTSDIYTDTQAQRIALSLEKIGRLAMSTLEDSVKMSWCNNVP